MHYFLNVKQTIHQHLWQAVGVCLLFTSTFVQSNVCDLTQFESSSEQQFNVTNLGTAVDTTTQLEWKVCAEGQTWQAGVCIGAPESYNWNDALAVASTVNTAGGFAGKNDWRLPNIKELATLGEYRCIRILGFNLTIFPVEERDYEEYRYEYWSSSPATSMTNAWAMNFFRAASPSLSSRTALREVRLVRDVPVPD